MYIVGGHSNGLYFYHGRPDVRRCPNCQHLLHKWDEDITKVPMRRVRKYDISISYDGVQVWDCAAKEVYDRAQMSGLHFAQLSNPEFYAVRASSVLQYDATCTGTRFLNQCGACKQWEFVGTGTPVVLMPGSVVPSLGFARTDLEFAAKDEKQPLLICGDGAAKILKAAKLRGLELEKALAGTVSTLS